MGERVIQEKRRWPIVSCRGCKKQDPDYDGRPSYHPWSRVDAYGIYTGIYCDCCYNSSRYPYRKDEYFDPDFAGERLDEDY